jgi:hypothetical protein
MSDHQVSHRRSSNGKPNSVAGICLVSSIDTRCTRSKGSPTGRASRMRAARARIVGSSTARLPGATIALTDLRCSSCFGGSIAMQLGRTSGAGRSASAIPPSWAWQEKLAWSVSTAMMSCYLVVDQ